MNEISIDIPFKGRHHLCEKAGFKKLYKDTIVFVPFFGASQKSLQRHVDLVTALGFDAVTFDLMDDWSSAFLNVISSQGLFGLKHVWADQIERILNSVQGSKIIYGFSNPNASAFEAIARRNAWDISGMICDGGPSGKLSKSMVRYFATEKPLPSIALRMVLATITANLWSPDYPRAIGRDLSRLPKGFRILSIRGWKDPLISPEMIDLVFEGHNQIDWEKLSLPEGKHLDGLKEFPELYVPRVESFLKEIAQPS